MELPCAPLYLSGPTAGGKTAVAPALGERIGAVEIVNADAFQIYRGMDILSAAPTDEEKAALPHHLFGILSASESSSAAEFAALANSKIREVGERALPLVVGGSGLYLKAITHGLAPTPKGDAALRSELDALSLDELVARYRDADPIGSEQTNLKNRRYVTRNLEITLLAGRPASEIKSEWQENQPDIRAVYLSWDRESLYHRINARTVRMFESGVVEEIAALPEVSETAAKAIGYREIRSLLDGEMESETCVEKIQQLTRHYAKRQETWFRREPSFRPVPVTERDSPGEIADRIISLCELEETIGS